MWQRINLSSEPYILSQLVTGSFSPCVPSGSTSLPPMQNRGAKHPQIDDSDLMSNRIRKITLGYISNTFGRAKSCDEGQHSTACHIAKQQNWTSFETWQVKLISQNNKVLHHMETILVQETALSLNVFLWSVKLDLQPHGCTFPINLILAHLCTFLQRDPSQYYAYSWDRHIKIIFTFLGIIQSKTFVLCNFVHELKANDKLDGLNP